MVMFFATDDNCKYIENWAAQARKKVPLTPEEEEEEVREGEEERTESIQDDEDLEEEEEEEMEGDEDDEERAKLLQEVEDDMEQTQVRVELLCYNVEPPSVCCVLMQQTPPLRHTAVEDLSIHLYIYQTVIL